MGKRSIGPLQSEYSLTRRDDGKEDISGCLCRRGFRFVKGSRKLQIGSLRSPVTRKMLKPAWLAVTDTMKETGLVEVDEDKMSVRNMLVVDLMFDAITKSRS
jgi:hypothetical protein